MSRMSRDVEMWKQRAEEAALMAVSTQHEAERLVLALIDCLHVALPQESQRVDVVAEISDVLAPILEAIDTGEKWCACQQCDLLRMATPAARAAIAKARGTT